MAPAVYANLRLQDYFDGGWPPVLWQNRGMQETVLVELAPLGKRFEVARGSVLADILADQGVEFPCGGSDLCGGCRVRVIEGELEAGAGDQFVFTEEELAQGWRLACRARAETPLKLEVGQWVTPVLVDAARLEGSGRTGLGIAVDVGTTTVAAQLLDLASGEVLGVRTALNPQCAFGADVMSRVSFAMSSAALTPLIRNTIGEMTAALAGERAPEVREVVLVGNTVMHHLFGGVDVEPLSHAPFTPKNDGEQYFAPEQLDWALPPACRIRFLPCLGGFVGSDILAGMVAVSLADSERLRALIDLGTNGEIALGNRDRILCASTAAGPAFEAASIRMGMRAATGAISHVFLRDGSLECHVIGGAPARGICGSGVVDAVAAGLDMGVIRPGGGFAAGIREFHIHGPVSMTQADIRELQLAKAAIASGLRLLLRHWGAGHDDLEVVHLAGAFGNYVRFESAVRIGLLELAPCKISAAGNTALRGAKQLLLSPGLHPSVPVEHVPLAFMTQFQDLFVRCLSFPVM